MHRGDLTKYSTVASTSNRIHQGYQLGSPLVAANTVAAANSAQVAIAAASAAESVVKEEIKSHFSTTEGVYKRMTITSFKQHRGTINNPERYSPNVPMRISLVTVPPGPSKSQEDMESFRPDKICVNIGRDIQVYDFISDQPTGGAGNALEKRFYRGSFPTCHEFNQLTARHDSVMLVVGFSAGQTQIVDLMKKESGAIRVYNEERTMDKTTCTVVKWVPGQPDCFVCGHSSGNILVMDSSLPASNDPVCYELQRPGDGYSVYSCSHDVARNPVLRIQLGNSYGSAVNDIDFSPGESSLQMAVVTHDGYLRIFDFATMELVGVMKSYFGGLLCLAWSPDAKLIATGGEDDLLTVYSVVEKRVICRGQGHRSWISRVAFDPFVSGLSGAESTSSLEDGAEENSIDDFRNVVYTTASVNKYGYEEEPTIGATPLASVIRTVSNNGGFFDGAKKSVSPPLPGVESLKNNSVSNNSVNFCGMGSSQAPAHNGYRIGTVGYDTNLLLWDLTEDVLWNPVTGNRHSTVIAVGGMDAGEGSSMQASTSSNGTESHPTMTSDHQTSNSTKNKLRRIHKRGFSLGNRLSRAVGITAGGVENGHVNGLETNGNNLVPSQIFGTPVCPKMNQVPVIEPLMRKKIAHERLTVLFFREDCIVTGCQEGFICTWSRPGRTRKHSIGSGKTTTSALRQVDGMNAGGTNV